MAEQHHRRPGPERAAGEAQRAQRVWKTMYAFAQAQDRNRAVARALDIPGGVGRLRMLLLLDGGPMSMRQLADAHGVDASYATQVIDAFTSADLVTRTEDPNDRRRRLVTLTPAGHAAVDTANDIYGQPPPALDALDVQQLAALEHALAPLIASQAQEQPPQAVP